jgi:WD40 repeat protein
LLNTFEKSHKCLNYKVDVDIIGNDSMVITGSEQETGCAVLYDLVRATPIQTLSTSINGICSSVAAHPTNSSVLLTAQCDGKVTVWERSDTTDIGLKS